MLDILYKEYKNRNKNFDKYSCTQYINYLDEILKDEHIVTSDTLSKFKKGNNIHYVSDTIIGKNIYNAKVISIDNESIVIKPSGWKNKGLKFNVNDNVYLCKGYI